MDCKNNYFPIKLFFDNMNDIPTIYPIGTEKIYSHLLVSIPEEMKQTRLKFEFDSPISLSQTRKEGKRFQE